MLQTAFQPSCINRTSVFEWHKRFKGSRCGRSKGDNTPELIGQRVRVRVICWGLKGVQEEILSEEASTHQIGSVAFPPGQCTSLQLHPCHRIFDHVGIMTVLSLPIVQTLLSVTFGYSLSSEASVVIKLRRWKMFLPRSLTLLHKRTSMGPSRS